MAEGRTGARVVRRWTAALLPLGLLGALLGIVAWWGPADAVRGDEFPPVEVLTFQRVILEPNLIRATVLNDGPDPIAIAQVQVDDAFWMFSTDRGQVLDHLDRTTLEIPYPWSAGDTHVIRVLTSTGVTFEHEIAVAVETPQPSLRFFGVFTLIGLYVGVLPVAIGLLWFPFLAGLSRARMDFLLALTIGLLAFLLVDGTQDGLEAAGGLAASFQGAALFALSVAGAYLVLEWVGRSLRARRRSQVSADSQNGWLLALLVAIGIGLHNFGEGLAIGSAFALGEAALGSLLIVGFALHNTTEGLAIVAPLAREGRRVSVGSLVQLGLIGGVPTIAGAWLGGFVYSPVWSVLFLGLGVGAIAQVIAQFSRQLRVEGAALSGLTTGPALAGLSAGCMVMYVTGMLIG